MLLNMNNILGVSTKMKLLQIFLIGLDMGMGNEVYYTQSFIELRNERCNNNKAVNHQAFYGYVTLFAALFQICASSASV